jgi:hypothetical protein
VAAHRWQAGCWISCIKVFQSGPPGARLPATCAAGSAWRDARGQTCLLSPAAAPAAPAGRQQKQGSIVFAIPSRCASSTCRQTALTDAYQPASQTAPGQQRTQQAVASACSESQVCAFFHCQGCSADASIKRHSLVQYATPRHATPRHTAQQCTSFVFPTHTTHTCCSAVSARMTSLQVLALSVRRAQKWLHSSTRSSVAVGGSNLSNSCSWAPYTHKHST